MSSQVDASTTSTLTESASVQRASPIRKRVIQTSAILFLASLALIFLLRDPLHYLIDQTPRSFGRFWPNRFWLLVHIIAGLAAILIGPLQFSRSIRQRFRTSHRWSGRAYITAVLLAGAAAFYLCFFAEQASFGIALFALAVAWWLATGLAFVAIRRRHIPVHQRWMIRSYIITFAFVTFRWIGLLPVWDTFGAHRQAVATWIAWLLPVGCAEIILRRNGSRRRETA